MIGVRWAATSTFGELFPTLDANLELDPTEDGRTRVVLVGSYPQPLRRLGASIDRLLLNAVAASTERGFVTRLTASLQPAAQAGAAPAPGWGGTDLATA